MHHDISYTGTDQEKRIKAIRDIFDWLGPDRFANLRVLFIEQKENGMTRDEFHMAMSFAGIQGYPVNAWADDLGFPADPDNSENLSTDRKE